jgi:hypothetical protein
MGFYPVATTRRQNTHLTHHAHRKHSTQKYTNIKGRSAHNDYNANTITIQQIELRQQLYKLTLTKNKHNKY